ncbi:alpha/beta hydrolase [Lactobacillus sp. PV034]|uniref:alpha/beta hydrolase n=1 Tax=Lactobacillus sp. PV034 TaxID=2594495 RepID=UPI00224040AA|nr:alpha/beta fold hydrolase [Lactobacillus sp. PV034]QNQ80460.1 lysophospholipase [Lactobacillus sp. PV034]
MTRVTFMRDGLELVGDLEIPNQDNYDLVIMMHGFTANRNTPLFKEIVADLNQAEIASLRFDFNGHGESGGKFENMTVINEVADANAVLEEALKDKRVRNIYLLGHSQGGVVASLLAALYPDIIKKLVLMAPAAALHNDALVGNTQGVTYDPKHIPTYVDYHGKKLGGFYLRTAQALHIYEQAQRYAGPVIVIAGTNDKTVDPMYAKKYNTIYANSRLELINGGDHRFNPPYQEVGAKIATDFLSKKEG